MTTINITPSKPSDVEFDLSIQGLDINNQVSVRLVILNLYKDIDLSIHCTRGKDSKWLAIIPPGIPYGSNSYKFKIEVVVNEYYFEPADGEINIVLEPVERRPVISATFETVAPVEKPTTTVTETIVDVVQPPQDVAPDVSEMDNYDSIIEIDSTPFPSLAIPVEVIESAPPVVSVPPKRVFERGTGTLLPRNTTGRPVVKGMMVSKEITESKLKNSAKVLDILRNKI